METEFFQNLFKKIDKPSDCPKGWIVLMVKDKYNHKYTGEVLEEIFYVHDNNYDFLEPEYLAINIEEFESFDKLIRLMSRYLNVDFPVHEYGSKWAFMKPSCYFTVLAVPIKWLDEDRSKTIEFSPDFLNYIRPSEFMKPNSDSIWTITRTFNRKKALGMVSRDIKGSIRRSALEEMNNGTKNLTILKVLNSAYYYDFDLYQFPVKLVMMYQETYNENFKNGKVYEVAFEND